MKIYSRIKTIDSYFERIDTKQMDFSHMRKELEAKNIDPAEIKIVIHQVDNQLRKIEEVRGSHTVGKNLFYGGLILATAGGFFTIATYIGIIDLGESFVIAHGPFIGGVITASTGFAKMNRSF